MIRSLTHTAACLALFCACAATPLVETVIQEARADEAQAQGPETQESESPGPGRTPADEDAAAGNSVNGGSSEGDAEKASEGGDSTTGQAGPFSTLIPTRRAVLEAQEFSPEELAAEAAARKEALDTRCRELLEAARAEDASYDTLMAAARALVFNADLRIQTHLAFAFDESQLPKPMTLIDAEDDVPSSIKNNVRSLAKESRRFAERALDLRPGDAAGELFSTLGVGLSLWSMGPLQALANGAATTLPRRVKEIAEAHPAFEGASPLRLKGRFQSRAPWPYKDKSGAVETLEQAVELAPIPLNLLFLGDAYWINDQQDQAVATWKRASEADADADTELTSPFLRRISRLRMAAAASRR